MARRSHSSQNRGHNSRDRYEDTPEYDTEDFAHDDYDVYDQGGYQPRTLGSVRSAGLALLAIITENLTDPGLPASR